jgi:spectinomycin phosphotransferase
MFDDPGLDTVQLAGRLALHYGIDVSTIQFEPKGFDMNAAVYTVIDHDGAPWFLKVIFGDFDRTSLDIPAALVDMGVPNVLAPMRADTGDPWCRLDGDKPASLILYPFTEGENAMNAGLSEAQWRTFGSTLRAVHDSGLHRRFSGLLEVESFGLPVAPDVRRLLAEPFDAELIGARERFAAFLNERSDQIARMLTRADSLGRALQSRPFELVLCHADIHAANVLAGNDGAIHLIDWDGPLIAPRERDLLFVIGSQIARTVEPHEEAWFFEGYGRVSVDPKALIYYRYERILQDIAEFGRSVLYDEHISEQTRLEEVDLAESFFDPGGMLERAEVIVD